MEFDLLSESSSIVLNPLDTAYMIFIHAMSGHIHITKFCRLDE